MHAKHLPGQQQQHATRSSSPTQRCPPSLCCPPSHAIPHFMHTPAAVHACQSLSLCRCATDSATCRTGPSIYAPLCVDRDGACLLSYSRQPAAGRCMGRLTQTHTHRSNRVAPQYQHMPHRSLVCAHRTSPSVAQQPRSDLHCTALHPESLSCTTAAQQPALSAPSVPRQ